MGIPLWFEALPPDAAAGEAGIVAQAAALAALPKEVAFVHVPEVLDGAYTTASPVAFAAALQETTGRPTAVNCVSVHRDQRALEAWADEVQAARIGHVVFVGGDSSRKRYPGLGVEAALRGVGARFEAAGVVTIPTRRRPTLDEPERLWRKQQAGASFAVSQILGEPVAAAALQRDAAALARRNGTKPIPLAWSLAPVRRRKDLEFLAWLGVEFPHAVRKRLEQAGSRRLEESHAINLEIARALLVHAEEEEHGPIGFSVEHVMQTNVEAAFGLVERLVDVTKEFSAVTPWLRA